MSSCDTQDMIVHTCDIVTCVTHVTYVTHVTCHTCHTFHTCHIFHTCHTCDNFFLKEFSIWKCGGEWKIGGLRAGRPNQLKTFHHFQHLPWWHFFFFIYILKPGWFSNDVLKIVTSFNEVSTKSTLYNAQGLESYRAAIARSLLAPQSGAVRRVY